MAAKKEFGTQAVADLLNRVDDKTRERLLLQLAKADPVAWARIHDQMFTFEELAKLDDAVLRELLAKVPQQKLALALRKASLELKSAFLRNLSRSGGEALSNAIQALGPQRLSLVEAAQREIVEVAKSLRK